MFRSAFLILSGNTLGSVLLLARSLVIARLISVENFGIASTFALSMSIVEMMSALGLQQQIVQHADGDSPHLQAALQGFQLLRAALSSTMLLLLAAPIATFFGIPQVAWAYRVMAILPLLNGVTHFDIYRLNRHMNYLPGILATVISVALSLILVFPLAHIFGDYRVMLFAVVAQTITAILVSHLVARRPYRITLDRKIMREGFHFGWPVLLNGILLFAVFNGERMIVGRELGMASLAVFSLAFSLILTPTLVMEKSGQSFFLPQLSVARTNPDRFRHIAMVTFETHLLFGAVTVVGIALLGQPIVHLLLGAKYAAALPLLTWLAIMQGIRVAKGGSSTVSLSWAHTENGLVASLMRVALLPLAWYIVAHGGNLIQMIWIGTAGEIVGFAAALLMTRRRLRQHLHLSLAPLTLPLASTIALYSLACIYAADQSLYRPTALPQLLTGGLLLILLALAAIAMKDLRLFIANRSNPSKSV